MGSVPSLTNATAGESSKRLDSFDIDSIEYYSALKSQDGKDAVVGGKESPIYISLPSLDLSARSAHAPREEKSREEHYVTNHRNFFMEHPYTQKSRNILVVPRDAKSADPTSSAGHISKLSPTSASAIFLSNTTSSLCSHFHQNQHYNKGKSTKSSSSSDHPYPSHQFANHHHQSQSQGSLDEDCLYYCFDENTFFDSDSWRVEEAEPLYSFLPFSKASASAGVNNTAPLWSASVSRKAPLPARHPRRLATSSSFARYLSDIFEASLETSNIDNMALGDLSQDPVYLELVKYWKENGSKLDMRELFKNDQERFKKFSLELEFPDPDGGAPLLLDFSKNLINDDILKLLLNLAKSRKVEEKRDEMFSAGRINRTENRAVLHVALRARPDDLPINLEGKNVITDVSRVLSQMEQFCNDIIGGKWVGYTGKKITDVVNIGIGGSDLGPCMVCEALTQYRIGPKAHFVSNVDESHLTDVLNIVNPETTLFIIASKTFTTQETITNAQSARKWFLEKAKDESVISKHFVALSTNIPKVKEFGISTSFEFWDYVGGRYSLWSAIGLSIALQSGFENFRKMLDGARFVDQSFRSSPLEKNVPAILALLGVWYNSVLGWESHAILPYDQFLSKLPAYLQQADMESNGKSTTLAGGRITSYNTGPVIWGQAGTNGQHAFYQLLHQGTRQIPADFIGFVQKSQTVPGISHHSILLANLIAQPEALMVGRTPPEAVPAELRPHKFFPGNRPTNMILAKKLTPFTLGALIAIYEHKIFVQGTIWNVNSFDQWGVELGKELAKAIEPELAATSKGNHDGSTQGIIDFILKHGK